MNNYLSMSKEGRKEADKIMREFCLNDNRKELEEHLKNMVGRNLTVSDMSWIIECVKRQDKEFIKKLKEDIFEEECELSNFFISKIRIKELINKLAGEKLIEEKEK